MDWSDVARASAVVLTTLCALGLPQAIMIPGRAARGWLLVLAIELFVIGAAIAVVLPWGEPIRWYRTPFVLAAGLVGVVYLYLVRREWKRKQRAADEAE